VYQGHRVKVKVAEAKKHDCVSVCGWSVFDKKAILFNTAFFTLRYIIQNLNNFSNFRMGLVLTEFRLALCSLSSFKCYNEDYKFVADHENNNSTQTHSRHYTIRLQTVRLIFLKTESLIK